MKSEINITPLVDVVLVLLIIFMVVTPMIQSGYDATVPPKSTKDSPKIPQLVVRQNSEESVTIDDQQIPIGKLQSHLAGLLGRGNRTVFYSGADTLKFGAVVITLDMIHNAGAQQLGIVTNR